MKILLFLFFVTFQLRAETLSFPEPMVFDLVRGLDNKKGEVEANILTFSRDGKSFDVSPEIEASVMDGLAFELETPFQDGKIEALKFASQYTFYQNGEKLLMGLQGIYEKSLHTAREDLTLVSVVDYRINGEWTVVAIGGARTAIVDHQAHHGVVLLNLSVFYQSSKNIYLGIENDKNIYFINKGAKISTIPQVSVRLNKLMRLQTGVGQDWGRHQITGYMRLIGEY